MKTSTYGWLLERLLKCRTYIPATNKKKSNFIPLNGTASNGNKVKLTFISFSLSAALSQAHRSRRFVPTADSAETEMEDNFYSRKRSNAILWLSILCVCCAVCVSFSSRCEQREWKAEKSLGKWRVSFVIVTQAESKHKNAHGKWDFFLLLLFFSYL